MFETKIYEDFKVNDIRIGIPYVNPQIQINKWNQSRLRFWSFLKEFHPSGLAESNLDAWDNSLELFSAAGHAKLQGVSLPNAPLAMSCYSILTSCEVASNFSRYDGLRFGHHSQLEPANYTLEEIITKNRNESLGRIVKGRIVCGNYFLLKK